jgi:DNA translocase FtsK/SpoIIIE-like protein
MTMWTWWKWSKSMAVAAVVFAACVFLLLALVSFQKEHYDNPEGYENISTMFYSVSKALFGGLGGSAYFLVTIALAWSVIVFFRERNRELLPRAAGLAVLVCAAATLFGLWGGDYLGGRLGAGIAGLLETFPGAVVGSILVSLIFVVSFIVATDWLFYSALREAVAGPDLLTDEKPPVALPAAYDEDQLIVSEEELEPEAEEEVEDEEPEEEIAEEPEESPATVAAVPEGLRKVLGPARRTIEIEETGVELAEDESDESSPVVSIVAAPEEESEAVVDDEVRQPVGQQGHEIAVHTPDVEFADDDEPADELAPATPIMAAPAAFEAEDVLVSEEVEFPRDDAATADEKEPEPESLEETPVEETPVEEAPEPDPESPFAGVVLEDEVVEWGAAEAEAEPVIETEPVIEDEPIVEDEPEPETEVESAKVSEPGDAEEIVTDEAAPPVDKAAPENEPPVDDEPEPPQSTADDKFDSVLDSLLGPAPSPVTETESAAAVATEEAPEVSVPDVEPETDLPAPEAPEAEIIDEEPAPQVETQEDVAAPEEEEGPEVVPDVDVAEEDAEEPAAPDADAPAKDGLVGWFRKNKSPEDETDTTASAETPKRTRRRVSETPELFDPEPTDRPVEADTKLIDDAALLVIEMGRASVVLIQRRLGIGYNRARKLVEKLVEKGVLGPMGETGSHPVLLSEEAWREKQSPVA